VIDGTTNTIVTSIPTAGFHTGIDVNPITNKVYVSQQFAGSVRIIDGATNTVITDLPVPGSPISDLAINSVTNKLYVIRQNIPDVAVFDASTNILLTAVPVPATPVSIAVNPNLNRIYVASGVSSSVVTVIDGASDAVITTLAHGSTGSSRIAVNSVTHRVYVTNATGNLAVIDGSTNSPLPPIPGTGFVGVGVNSNANRIYVGDFSNDAVAVFDGATNSLLSTAPVGDQPHDIAIIPNTNRIYVSNDAGHNVSVIEDLPCGGVSFSGSSNLVGTSTPQFVAIADLNGDSKLDLVVTNFTSVNSVSVLLGDGTGNFGAPASFGIVSPPRSVAVGDFNGDNRLDVAVANFDVNNIGVLLGDGTGSFGPATYYTVGSQPRTIAIADYNMDNKLDLAVANENTNNVAVLLGDGAGSFGSATFFGVGTQPNSIAIGDFNGDNKPDLAVTNHASNNVSILLGNGVGGFSPATHFSAGTVPFYIALGDFNEDNKLDIAVANFGSNDVSILLGDGMGSLGSATNFSVGTSPFSLATGDFNSDGKLDLAAANQATNNVSILLGDGIGSFSTATNFGVGTDPRSLAVGDFNGDSKPDLAIANFGSNNASILLNTFTPPPTADAGESQIICPGGSVQIGGTPTGSGGSGTLSFSWTPTDGLDNPNAPNPTATPSSTTTFTVEVTDASGCKATDQVTVTVVDNTAPVVTANLIHIPSSGDDDDEDDDDDQSGIFGVGCSASDNCDPDPSISSVIETPSLINPNVTFKVKNTKKLTIDTKKNKVTVEGPSPQTFWADVQSAGGISVSDGQEVEMKFSGGQVYKYEFDSAGNLNEVIAPVIVLRCTATDASGNSASATASPVFPTEDDDDDDESVVKTASAQITIESSLPENFALEQNYPNPFNPSTTINFAMPKPGTVKLQIYNITGQLIQTLVQGEMPAGRHSLAWNGRDRSGALVPSGIYFYQLVVQGRTGELAFAETRKMNLIK